MPVFPSQYANVGGIMRIKSRSVNVTADTVTYTFNPDNGASPTSGLILVYLVDLPAGTTTTLPVVFSMAGQAANLTLAGGANATVADVPNPGVFLVFYDRSANVLQLIQ